MKIDNATIRITNLRLRTYIGFNPEELQKQQDVVINTKIEYNAQAASQADAEDLALNYKTITKKMIAHVEHGKFRLLEALAADLLAIVFDHQQVLAAEITVDKPHALRFPDSVSITLASRR